MTDKKIIFSGIKPSGRLNIGGYIGALSQWVEMQDKYNCVFCVVDYHAITVKQDPTQLKAWTMELVKTYLAAGIDYKNTILFKQSDVPAHTELAWILNCCGARISDLNKMTQFKDKAKINDVNTSAIREELISIMKSFLVNIRQHVESNLKNSDNRIVSLKKSINKITKINKEEKDRIIFELLNIIKDSSNLVNETSKTFSTLTSNIEIDSFINSINDLSLIMKNEDKLKNITVGLYDYPVLMAADILLYNTEIVPVGEDQKQHVELARDIARRFNKEYSEIFKIPESVVRKEGARIMSLQDPTKKMSKSDESGLGCIDLLDDIESAKKKIMRALTDSDGLIKYDVKNKPAVSNLLTIYSYLGNKSIKEIEKEYEGKGYGDFKKGLADVVGNFLQSFQDKYYAISDGEVLDILEDGREKAAKIANATLDKARLAIGVR